MKKQIKQQAIDQLLFKYDLTETKASVWVNKYYDAVITEIRSALTLMDKNQIALGYFPINVVELRKKIRFTIKGKLIDIIADTDLLTVIALGSNLTGKRTLMKTQIPLTELHAIEDAEDTFKRIYGEHEKALRDPTAYEQIVIDEKSLQNYYDRTRVKQAADAASGKDITKLASYLQIAQDLLQIQKVVGFIPHIKKVSQFGRTYYLTALSLQNIPKVVREAALGKCTSIDVSNSVFNWRATIVKEISPGIKIPYTLEYLDQKDYHRKRLVEKVFADSSLNRSYCLGIIKQAITSIGFGAKTEDAKYYGSPALDNLFKPQGSSVIQKKQLNLFKKDPFMKSFIAEQKMIGDIIYKYFKDSFKGTKNLEYVSSNRGIEKTKVLAWLYQQAETDQMQPVYDMLGDKVLLKVHDGFYVKDLTKEETLNFKQYFYEANIVIDIKEVDPWKKLKGNVDTAIELTVDTNDREREHRKFKAQEEKRAAVYKEAQIMKQKRAALKGTVATHNSISTSTNDDYEIIRNQLIVDRIKDAQDDNDHNTHYESTCYDGSGYTGQYYNEEFDPFFDSDNDIK